MPDEQRTLPQIDEALDGVRAKWDHGDAPYVPEILALIRAAESMRTQLFGSLRDDVDPMPVFVLRGRDGMTIKTLECYREYCADEGLDDQADQVHEAINEITEWQQRNPGLVKLPDHAHVPALPHAADMAPLLGRKFERDAVSE
jgi:hypothetical protein